MIQQPKNWETVTAFSDRQKLPVGAYVCKVLKCTVEHYAMGEQLLVGFDIVEGEHASFYRHEFDASNDPQRKWKGILRVWLPTDDGSERDELTKRGLKGMVTSFEKSNPGYTWNWDETSLVGKLVGILYRNEQYDYNGHQGWSARPLRAMSVESVRSGDYTLPKDKPLKGDAADIPSGFTAVETNDLPF